MKILIVEDEIELLIAMSNFLVREKYICELAESFLKADEKLSIYEYDIILLDISLPDGNGLELLKTIKKIQIKAGVIIAILHIISSVFSFISIRTKDNKREILLEKIADYFFLFSLLGIFFVIMMILVNFTAK